MRLAIIGAGAITAFHLNCCRELEIEVTGIAARNSRGDLNRIVEKFGIQSVYNSWEMLLSRGETFDALLICTPPEISTRILLSNHMTSKPTLVEKPGAIRSADMLALQDMPHLNLFFGYNRRFYESVADFRMSLSGMKGFLNVTIVEDSIGDFSLESLEGLIVKNSVHLIDLTSFILGEVDFENFKKFPEGLGCRADIINLQSELIGDIQILFGAIQNSSLVFTAKRTRLDLKPIEVLTKFNQFEIIEPSDPIPIRKYVPVWNSSSGEGLTISNSNFKPGLLAQMGEFKSVVNHVKDVPTNLATVGDNFRTLQLAEKIVQFLLAGIE
jgi:predicted dehydrogenase